MDWPWPSRDIVLAGDFNSVQSPHLDLFGGTRTGRPESAQLVLLLTTLRLEDSRILLAPANDDDPPEPTELRTGPNPRLAESIGFMFLCSGRRRCNGWR